MQEVEDPRGKLWTGTHLLMIITMIVMMAPKKMKPPKIATAMIPSRLYLAFARLLCALAGWL